MFSLYIYVDLPLNLPLTADKYWDSGNIDRFFRKKTIAL